MKVLNLEGLTNYTTKLLNKIATMLDGKADKNHTHDKSEQLYSYTIDLSNSTYNQNTYYPVVGNPFPDNGFSRIKLSVQLNSGTVPTWSTHDGGFTCSLDLLATSIGCGRANGNTIILDHSYLWAESNPCGYYQLHNSSRPVLWLRGGGKYFVWSDYEANFDIKTSEYTEYENTVAPTTNYPGIVLNKATIIADLNGNADTIDGYHADGLQKVMTPVTNNSNVLEYAENYPITQNNGTFFTYRVYNGYGEPYSESGVGSGDYYYYANKLDDKWITIIAVDVRSPNMFLRAKNDGTWNSSWRKISDDGNADTLDGYHANNFAKLEYKDNTNWDTIVDGGMYRLNNIENQTNYINGMTSYGQLLVVRGSNDTIAQMYFNYTDNNIFSRSANGVGGGTVNWTEWHRLYSSVNMTYGTDALTPGSSGLATGSFYFQYE